MNILIISAQGGLAGSTYSISFLAQGLAEKGHTVYVASKKGSLLFELLSDTDVILIPFSFVSKTNRAAIQNIRKIVQTYHIEVINAQSSKDRYQTIFAKWFYRLPVKLVHTRRQRPLSLGGWLHNNFYVKGTDKIVVISDELKRMFIRRGFPPTHLHVIYNGTPRAQYEIDPQRVEALRQKLGIQPEDTVIGCVARMKKQDQLIRALPYLNENIKVLFVGIEPGSLDTLVQKCQIKNPIVYAGALSHQDTLHTFKLMDVNVLPSTMDGFGLVLVEAMALDVPVIGTRVGGIMNVIDDGENGLLYEDEDVQGLANGINLILEDQALKEKLIRNGQKTAYEKFSIENTINHYEAFFSELVKQ